MRIDGKLPFAAPAAAAPRAGTAAGRFDPRGEGVARRPGAAVSSAPLATMDAILALQGEDDPAERRRRHARRGSDLLDGLDRLKAQLLSGRVAAADLKALAARLAERSSTSGDPRLDDIVGQIELRAEVELAKLAGRRD
jgi:hypothetical protein